MTNHPNRNTRLFTVTQYSPKGEQVSELRAKTAKDAVIAIANGRSLASFTALDPQHGRGEAWTDNAYGQFDAAGRYGVYARVAG